MNRNADSELAQVEAALKRIRRKEAKARACDPQEAHHVHGWNFFLIQRYQDARYKDAVDSIARELLDKCGARDYTRTEIATVAEGLQQLPAPGAELVKRAARLGAVQRDILRDMAKFQAAREHFSQSEFFYRPEQLGGARDRRVQELAEQPESPGRNAELRRLARRLPQDFTGKAGNYRVGERDIPKADFLRAIRRLESLGLVSVHIPPKAGSPDRYFDHFDDTRKRHRYSWNPARREREYAWSLTDEGELFAYAVLHEEPWHPGVLAQFVATLHKRQTARLGLDRDRVHSISEDFIAMVHHAAGRIALERLAEKLRRRAVAEKGSVRH